MAPSRRKSASKAAAAAAARRKWKVGDLVLAKVKGFPAWPAMVSEPGKWGYSTDWKKVLVHFYGTQQIAFCNPADVEAFTEEKKQSLLTKRHGKGSDFVRAVNEIIEKFEELKQQNQGEDCNSGEVAHINGEVSNSSANLESKDQLEPPEATHDSRFNSSHLTADGNVENLPAEDTSAAAIIAAADRKEEPAVAEEVTESPLHALYLSSKRTRDLALQNGLSLRKEPLVRRSRSSRLESRRSLDAVVQSGDISKRRSLEASTRNSFDLAALASSGSIEENNSEAVTVESHSLSLNEVSTIDSGSQLEHSETVTGDVELSKALETQIKAVTKKKRKPSRKRPTNDAVVPIAQVKEDEFPNTSESSQNNFEKISGSCHKENGDEHLPLVKRARVRMSEPSQRVCNTVTHPEGTSEETNKSSDCTDPLIREPSRTNSTLLTSSPPRGCSQFYGSRANFWKAKKDQSYGSIDDEAALPPSKRLHRALEAMSANAAEEDRACNDMAADVNMLTNGTLSPSTSRSPHAAMENQMPSGCKIESIGSDPREQADASGFNPGNIPETTSVSDLNGQGVEGSDIQNSEPSKESFVDAETRADEACGANIPSVTLTESPRHLLSSPCRKESFVRSAQGLEEELLPCKDKSDSETNELINNKSEETEKESELYEGTLASINPMSGAQVDDMEVSPQTDTGVLQLNTENTCLENIRSPYDNRDENDMSVDVAEVVNKQMLKEPSSESFPNGYSGDGVGVHSSPCLTDAGNSLVQASPFNTSSGRLSTSDNSSFIQNNGSCSPDVHVFHKTVSHPSFTEEEKSDSLSSRRPKSVGRYTESNAALSSFEALLGSLTRTKESIGRATRLAVDCAKIGACSKVVDILARSLESEPSLHRRVDLFFLVDSIMKGDTGGLYTSSIQATLPRLIAAAAPPGSSAHENRRQCLKVLRLWLEKKILSESAIRRQMRELDSHTAAGPFCKRSMRTERSFDDPIREMEGMLVDEYGSNSSFQLPGFCMPSMLKEDDAGSDSDGGSFEAVTPEHSPEHHDDNGKIPTTERHRHILEDVDGELEMEDAAPTCETELTSSSSAAQMTAIPHNQFEHNNLQLPYAPPLPQDVPPSSPPLPSSPPPPLSLPPPPPPPPPSSSPAANGVDLDANHYSDRSNTPTSNQGMSDMRYHESDHLRDRHRQQMAEPYPGRGFHSKNYPVRPPHPPPSNQYNFVREPHYKLRREGVPPPPSHYSSRYQVEQNWDRENYYNNHDRMKVPSSHESDDGWRHPPHSFSGPRYPGKGKFYEPDPFGGPQSEHTRYPNQGGRYPPRSMSHRSSMPYGPPLEGPIPVSNRGPSYWQPR